MSDTTGWQAGRHKNPYPGIESSTVDYGVATFVHYRFAPHARFPLHRHPEAQTVIVLQGSIVCRTPGRERTLGAGELIACEAWEPHGITAGADGAEFINVVVPLRTVDRTEVLE